MMRDVVAATVRRGVRMVVAVAVLAVACVFWRYSLTAVAVTAAAIALFMILGGRARIRWESTERGVTTTRTLRIGPTDVGGSQ